MDPFETCWEELLQNLIVQHFSGKEVLELFKVSQEWNVLLSKSNKAMSMIELVINESYTYSTRQVDVLESSDRLYRKMRFDRCRKNYKRKLNLIEKFSQSLVELELALRRRDVDFLPRKVTFPKLTVLSLRGQVAATVETLFEDVRTLKKLAISKSLYKTRSSEYVHWIIEQTKLKELIVYVRDDDIFAHSLIAHAPFALNTLLIQYGEPCPILSLTARQNFNSFMLRMSSSLTTLHLDHCFQEDIKLIHRMLSLKNFSIRSLGIKEMNGLKIKPNVSVVDFKHAIISKLLIGLFPNLEVLQTNYINKEDLEWVVKHSLNLKMLVVEDPCCIPAFDIIFEYYQHIKDTDPTYNRNITILRN